MTLPGRRLILLAAACTSVCSAVDLTAAIGAYKPYLDERPGLIQGGAVRIPISHRIALRPEILTGGISSYSHVLGLASVTFDFTDPGNGAVGYVVGSAGAARTRDRRISYVSVQRALLGGAGVRFAFANHWTAGAELRVGETAFPLVTFNVGYRWRIRK